MTAPARPWRTGRKVFRTVYEQLTDNPADGDRLIGLMDTPEQARLAAAAPKLFEALRGTISLLRRCEVQIDPELGLPEVRAALAAIAKAEGSR